MAGKLIFCIVLCICGTAFILLLNTASDTYPLNFWSGDNERLKEMVKDIPSYNRELKKVYQCYAGVFYIGGLFSLFSVMAGGTVLMLNSTAGLFIVYLQYKKILKKYS